MEKMICFAAILTIVEFAAIPTQPTLGRAPRQGG
jgi:hypothetical protein